MMNFGGGGHILAVSGNSFKGLTDNSFQQSTRETRNLHHKAAPISARLTIEVGRGISVESAQIRIAGWFN